MNAPTREMPLYKCHKEVWALKIKEIRQAAPADQERRHAGGDWLLIPEDPGYGPVCVGHDEYVVKHKPQAGGYYVVYDDGYKSYSPAKAFEDGYAPIRSAVATVQAQIQAVSTAPRVTPADIEANIASEHYFTAGQGVGEVRSTDYPSALKICEALDRITICVLILRNGHKIVGVNEGPVSAANFDPEIGKRYAREKAIDQIWPLMGYALRERLQRNLER